MNLQNIQRSDVSIKQAFLPKLDLFMFFDYDQIELRILAHYLATQLQDFSMAKVISEGADLHQKTADAIGYPRSDGKTLNFAITYGAGVNKISEQLGVSKTAARKILDAYHARWPGVRTLMELLGDELKERGFITTYGGRPVAPKKDYAALNYLIQGSGAVILKLAIIKLHNWCKKNELTSHMVSNIHDEIFFDAALGEMQFLLQEVPQLMRVEDTTVPIEVEASLSFSSWASKESLESLGKF